MLKARLEWPIVRMILNSATDVISTQTLCSRSEPRNPQFFHEMNSGDIVRAVRVGVECVLYWQLSEFSTILTL